ncbi:hypothetical protein OB905_11855 [Halobacteria archaeon AArc-dxtr1]|nr:hypothetical protein [Halobacteria archaeon AArc-dxtr1]
MSAFPQSTDGEPLDFLEQRDTNTDSWIRAHPADALLEKFGRYGYKVTLRGGADVHYCALGIENGEYIGRCDCKGWQYHDGPCAHLCTLRKADFIGVIDVEETDGGPAAEHEMHHATGEALDGDRHDPAIECAHRTEQEVRP